MLRKQTENSNFVDGLVNQNGKVDYRKELANRKPEMKSAKKAEPKDRSWAEEKGYDRTEYNNPVARRGSSVRPARCAADGGITDIGGPAKHVNVTGKNSIWDSEVLSKAASVLSSQETTRLEKESVEAIRQKKQAEYKQSMSPKLGDDALDLAKKASSVSPTAATSSGKGWIPANKLSMFDENTNFDRLTALTERVNPTVKKEEKQAQVKQASKALSSKDVTARFVDGIVDQSKESSYRSMHNDSVDRLYKVLAERNKENK